MKLQIKTGYSAVRLAHLLWEQGVVGSNPTTPTKEGIIKIPFFILRARMKFKTYIFLSKELDKYYTGSTSVSIEERLRRHNTNHKGYTGKVNDWELIYKKEFTDIKLSRKLEIKIKKRGARRYLESLKTK